MFQFSWLASTTYVFSRRLHSMTCAGLPHSGISGSTPVSGSPKLIAACYALHRPLTPRNPPQALLRLINKFSATSKRYSIVKELLPNLNGFIQILYNLLSGFKNGGGERARTVDPLRARQVLSQLSYTPIKSLPIPHFFVVNSAEYIWWA